MWLNHYLLIRHTPNGRKYPFLDCWGLVIEFYRRELGIELDDYTDEMLHTGLNRHCRVEKIRSMQFVETRIYRHTSLPKRKNET